VISNKAAEEEVVNGKRSEECRSSSTSQTEIGEHQQDELKWRPLSLHAFVLLVH